MKKQIILPLLTLTIACQEFEMKGAVDGPTNLEAESVITDNLIDPSKLTQSNLELDLNVVEQIFESNGNARVKPNLEVSGSYIPSVEDSILEMDIHTWLSIIKPIEADVENISNRVIEAFEERYDQCTITGGTIGIMDNGKILANQHETNYSNAIVWGDFNDLVMELNSFATTWEAQVHAVESTDLGTWYVGTSSTDSVGSTLSVLEIEPIEEEPSVFVGLMSNCVQ
jgi:hypothetical protein